MFAGLPCYFKLSHGVLAWSSRWEGVRGVSRSSGHTVFQEGTRLLRTNPTLEALEMNSRGSFLIQ